jgi:hypothetical protein
MRNVLRHSSITNSFFLTFFLFFLRVHGTMQSTLSFSSLSLSVSLFDASDLAYVLAGYSNDVFEK